MVKQARLVQHLSRRIANGHPCIYENEIDNVKGAVEKGDIIDVFSFSGQFVGKGYYNADSKIQIRLLSRLNERIDSGFVEKKLSSAWGYRKKHLVNENCYRLFNGLADGISGIRCDKYDDLFCVSSSTAGADRLIDDFVQTLSQKGADNIVIRNLSAARRKERIDSFIKIAKGNVDRNHRFFINDLSYSVDPFSGDDPFFYLEQRQNPLVLADYAEKMFKGADIEIFDLFCGYGQFGLNLLKRGFSNIEFIDTEQKYEQRIFDSAEGENFKPYSFSRCNAFDYLRRMDIENVKADIIILDPPPFTDSRKKKGKALNAYKEINLRALKILRKGGLLASSCCSQNVSREDFEMMFYSIASDMANEFTFLYRGGQPLDFPVRVNIFETDFLKFFILMKGEKL